MVAVGLFGWLVWGVVTSHAQTLNCLPSDQDHSLYRQLRRDAYQALDARRERFEKLQTAEDIREWQRQRREFLIDRLGGFPQRTALNARTVGVIEGKDYRIEKVIYDSQPHHRITANLYLPNAEGPVPGVVVSSGHSRTAKTADYNQRFGIMMARLGMAALCFDPIGQGERAQVLRDGKPIHNSTTTEHFLVGVGSMAVGRNTARYRVYDAIRSIDYLSSRPEVDGERIGFTGCSGGGTLTSYVMAIDDRVTCAAPACYLTTFRRLIETIGPQDAEQNIYGQLAFGLDQPDYVIMRAPRPTIISSTTDDFFPIEGSWDNYRQAKRVYGLLGFPERVDLVEMPGKHGVKPQNLASIGHWMQRWLLGRDTPVEAVELPTLPGERLLCTETGQVLTSLADEKSVFQLNMQYERERLAPARKKRREAENDAKLRTRIQQVLRVQRSPEAKSTPWRDLGRVSREDFHIDKLLIRPDDPTPLPALTYHPPVPTDDVHLYLHDAGKLGDGGPDGPIEELVREGNVVVTVDLRGQGETGPSQLNGLGDWKTAYLAYLLDRSLLGMRVEDTMAAADFVAHYQRGKNKPRDVHLVGVGRSAVIALHAAALRPDLFRSVTLRNPPADWLSLEPLAEPAGRLELAVHGALTVYDADDLRRLIGDKLSSASER